MKAIIFDFDGVIHDTFDINYKIHKILVPDSTPEFYKSYFDGNMFKKTESKHSETEIKRYRELEHQAFQDLIIEEEIKKELLELNNNYDLYIITSNTKKNLDLYFENNNFTGIFKDILSEETHKSKEEKFKLLFNKYKLNNTNCIFITDTLGDILEANSVDVKTIAVDFGFHERERLEKGNPYEIISDFKDIKKVIESL